MGTPIGPFGRSLSYGDAPLLCAKWLSQKRKDRGSGDVLLHGVRSLPDQGAQRGAAQRGEQAAIREVPAGESLDVWLTTGRLRPSPQEHAPSASQGEARRTGAQRDIRKGVSTQPRLRGEEGAYQANTHTGHKDERFKRKGHR